MQNTSALTPVPNFVIIGAKTTKLWWGALMPPPPSPWLTVQKKLMSNKVKKMKPTHWNLSFLVGNPKVFNFENFSFVVHFTVEQTGVLFGSLGIESDNGPFVKNLFILRTSWLFLIFGFRSELLIVFLETDIINKENPTSSCVTHNTHFHK